MTQKKKTLLTLSTGTLKYSGRKKGSPFARESLTIKFARILLQKHYRFVDITFVSKKGKFYRVIFKAFITARLIIRMIRIAKIHSWFHKTKKAKVNNFKRFILNKKNIKKKLYIKLYILRI